MPADNDIRGRLVLITGASGGIGQAIAHRLLLHEVDIALHYSTNAAAIESLVKDIGEAYYSMAEGRELRKLHISTHQADLASAEETTHLCEEVKRQHGRPVDVLICNAGYGKRIVDIWDITLSEFEYTLNVNLRAPFLLAKGFVDGMRSQNWGRIIFIGSISGHGAGINGCHYASSKAGLMGLSKNLANHLAEFNISVNVVAPAMVGETGMLSTASLSEEVVEGIKQGVPLKRLCEPEEVANVVEMIARTGFMTGEVVGVTGGLMHL